MQSENQYYNIVSNFQRQSLKLALHIIYQLASFDQVNIYLEASMAARKLYGSLDSPNTLKVLACLFEHNLDFDFVPINLDGGENYHKSFLSISVIIQLIPYHLYIPFFNYYFDLILIYCYILSNHIYMFFFAMQPFGQVPVFEDGDAIQFGKAKH